MSEEMIAALWEEFIFYFNSGLEHIKRGTPTALQEAVVCYDKAIELGEQLPKDNYEYQNNLAGTCYNRGNAQRELHQLPEAIASYNQAIAIREQLPKENPQYQYDLLGAYVNRGNSQSDLHQLSEAIASYNQAIAIYEQFLPKDNPNFFPFIANAYNNRGVVQRELHQLPEAIASYNQAIALCEQLPKENPQYQYSLASAYGNRANTYLRLNKSEQANEDAETGLDILRDLEKKGIYGYRSSREKVFNTTIQTYLACCPQFLLEFLLEHLDPINEGAAPQSEAMHQAALHGLQQLYLRAVYIHPELVPQIHETLFKLAQIRSLYFIGTASGANLMAQYYEQNLQDTAQAQQTLEHYIEHCPTDTEGYVNLANFYERRRQPQFASDTYRLAAKTILKHIPAKADAATRQELEAKSDEMLKLAAEKLAEQKDQARQQQRLQIFVTISHSLPATVKQLIELGHYLEQEIARLQQPSDEEQLAEIINTRFQEIRQKLHASELLEAKEQLQQLLPNVTLLEEEREALATALLSWKLQEFRLTGVSLGLAVETRLKQTFILLRQQWENPTFAPINENHPFFKVVLFVKKNYPVTLGTWIDILDIAFYSKKPLDAALQPIQRQIVDFFQSYANAAFAQSPKILKARREVLEQIVKARNACHHPNPIDYTLIKEMLENVLEHPERAFFRYFPMIAT